jgi:hypothetical protein
VRYWALRNSSALIDVLSEADLEQLYLEIDEKADGISERLIAHHRAVDGYEFRFSDDFVEIQAFADFAMRHRRPDVHEPVLQFWNHLGVQDGDVAPTMVVSSAVEKYPEWWARVARYIWHEEGVACTAWRWHRLHTPGAYLSVESLFESLGIGKGPIQILSPPRKRGSTPRYHYGIWFPTPDAIIQSARPSDSATSLDLDRQSEATMNQFFDTHEMSFSRESGRFNWNVYVEVSARDDEPEDEFLARFEAAPDALVELLRTLSSVVEVEREDRELIMVAVTGRTNLMREVKKALKTIKEGPLAGLTVDTDVEDNR